MEAPDCIQFHYEVDTEWMGRWKQMLPLYGGVQMQSWSHCLADFIHVGLAPEQNCDKSKVC